jgi:uncharacterized membrane protein HdeD (DUF308 family)
MSQNDPSSVATLSAALGKAIHDHWKTFLAEGILLVVLGLAAIVLPPLAGLAATVFLGWMLAFVGFSGILFTLGARRAPGYGWALLSAFVAIAAGGMLLWNPLQGLVTLTFVLTAFFIADGVVTIAYAIAHRRELSGRWEWMLVNGLLDLGLAALVLSGLPGTLAWALGLLLGIDLLFGGVSLIAIALKARAETKV